MNFIISTPPLCEEDEDPSASTATPEWRSFKVDGALLGQRLDRALVLRVPEFSRSYLQQLIEDGAVRLDDAVVRKSATRLRLLQEVRLEMRPTAQSQAFTPEAMPIHTVYEDEHLRVIDKPAGLVVHPAPGNWSGTLLNGLLALDTRAAALPRAGIVHRLDKDTSGLMVVARTRQAMDGLVAAIAERHVHRQYLALAQGRWSGPRQRRIDAPMGRDPQQRLRMAVIDLSRHSGKTAMTDVTLLAQADDFCVLRCVLHTGRTHQIRVHMAHIGHPLVADGVYGGTARAVLTRQALHAEKLAFTHPITGEALSWQSAPPKDLQQLLDSPDLQWLPEGL